MMKLTKRQLQDEYGITDKTMRQWLSNKGWDLKTMTPRQLNKLLTALEMKDFFLKK